MSKRYPGGLLSTTGVREPSVTDQSKNSGVWTLEEQYQADVSGTWANQSGAGYEIANSLRHSRDRNTYLRRAISAAGNPRVMTFSIWMKRGYINNNTNTADSGRVFVMLATNTAGSDANSFSITFDQSDRIVVGNQSTGLVTTNRYRDPSAWIHAVIVCDTTKVVPSDRTQLYVNGVRITTFDSASYPSEGAAGLQASGDQVMLGDHYGNGRSFDGHLAEIHYVDGFALDASSFGYFDYNGIWQPKRYTGLYGVTGFYLPFNPQAYGDSISTTTIGLDKSGNGNNLTSFNFSTTAGVNYDLMKDSPTNGSTVEDTGLGGQVSGNYATWDPLVAANFNNTGTMGSSIITFSNGNLNTFNSSASGFAPRMQCWSTIGMTTGKWYAEFTNMSNMGVGISKGPIITGTGNGIDSTIHYNPEGPSANLANGAVGTSFGTFLTATSTDTIGVAFDADIGTITWYKNGVAMGGFTSVDTTSTLYDRNRPWFFSRSPGSSGSSASIIANFGQRPFAFAAPAGFKCLNTANLPQPTIPSPKDHFDIARWIGSGESVRNIIGLNFKPDLFYTKVRNGTNWPWLSDSLRGLPIKSYTNDMGTEDTNPIYGLVRSFNPDGFTLGPGTGDPGGTISDVNLSTSSYVSWNWKASDTQVSNTSGSITTQVRVNNQAGFSIIGYTGNGVEGATIGHGLNTTPKLVIVRRRTGGSASWPVWTHITTQSSNSVFTGSTINIGSKSGGVLSLNLTNAASGYGMDGQSNASGSTYVAYCWAEIPGYSRIGSYTGNGHADGTIIYTGFKPRFILVKQTNAGEDWAIYDTVRNRENPMDLEIWPNQNATEYDGNGFVDFLSNGFKWRSARGNVNTSGNSYIFMAFAENPFKTARAR